MFSFRAPLHTTKCRWVPTIVAWLLLCGMLPQLNLGAQESKNTQQSASPARAQEPQSAVQQRQEGQPEEPFASPPTYDKSIFQNPIPSDQLAFLHQFAGAKTKDLFRDKQFHKLMHSLLPNVIFHYGRDMSLSDAMDMVMRGSSLQVQIREDRYVLIYGHRGPYLKGRGFLWIDMKDGLGLGAFFFAPTNGEPTPTVTVFSKQILEDSLEMSQLPPAFAQDLDQWAADSKMPMLTTRYFLTGMKEKILLEHDEDHCAASNGAAPPPESMCEQLNADAADIDMNAAYYLEETHHATNGTAWMITGANQVAWIQFRENTCRMGPDPLLCRIRLTRARTRTFLRPQLTPHS
ncbi:MAG: lysozyme inhibitor LprI family protein [Candidatus Acidiferrum sp.]